MDLPSIDAKYLDPRNWPFIVYFWFTIILIGKLPGLRRYILKQRVVSSWTVGTAKISSTTYSPASRLREFLMHRRNTLVGEISYSYVVEGIHYNGRYERLFALEAEAEDFIRDLQDRAVLIRYNPRKPARSMLLDSDLESLLASRPSSPQHEIAIEEAHEPPAVLRPLLWPLTIFALVGLVLSVAVHIATWFGLRSFREGWVFALHLGIFVVFIPAVILLEKTGSNDPTKMFARSPAWMKYMVEVLLAYALVNFAVFMMLTYNEPRNAPTGPVHWRGFSGHWMVFYSASLAILYPAATHKRRSGTLDGSAYIG